MIVMEDIAHHASRINVKINQFSSLCAVRKHDTVYTIHEDYSCSGCKDFLYQIMPCNMCPICTQ